MNRVYRTAWYKSKDDRGYGEWTTDKETVEREVALMLVNEPKTTSWLESQPEGFVLRQGNANASPSLDLNATT